MKLTVRDVARLFDVHENTVHRWIQLDGLPVETTNSQHRFDRVELLEWATARKIPFASALLESENGNGNGAPKPGAADALLVGKVVRITGSQSPPDLRSVLESCLDGVPFPPAFDRCELVDLLLARESTGSTAVGDGIAIPHPRYPVVLPLTRPLLRVCYLAHPLRQQGADGVPINTLLLLVCSTVHCHLQLLAQLAVALRDPGFHGALRSQSPEGDLVRELRRLEQPAAR